MTQLASAQLTMEDVLDYDGDDPEMLHRIHSYEIAAHVYRQAKNLFDEIVADGDLVKWSDEYQRLRHERVKPYRWSKEKARARCLAQYRRITR